jgi:anti-anti-sigma factor
MSTEESAAAGRRSDLVKVDITGDDNFRIASLVGEIDISNAEELTSTLTRMPNTLYGLIVDLTELTYLDSAGVRMLYELGKRLSLRSQSLVVISPAGRSPRRVLELTGVPERIRVVETLAEANEALSTAKSP